MALISRRDYVASIKQQSPATDSLCTYFKNNCAPANAAINDSVPSTTISMAVDGTIKGSLRMTKPVPDALFRQSHYCYPVFKFGKNHGALLNGRGLPCIQFRDLAAVREYTADRYGTSVIRLQAYKWKRRVGRLP